MNQLTNRSTIRLKGDLTISSTGSLLEKNLHSLLNMVLHEKPRATVSLLGQMGTYFNVKVNCFRQSTVIIVAVVVWVGSNVWITTVSTPDVIFIDIINVFGVIYA